MNDDQVFELYTPEDFENNLDFIHADMDRLLATAEHLRSLELQVAKLPKPMTEEEAQRFIDKHTVLSGPYHYPDSDKTGMKILRDLGLIVEEKQ